MKVNFKTNEAEIPPKTYPFKAPDDFQISKTRRVKISRSQKELEHLTIHCIYSGIDFDSNILDMAVRTIGPVSIRAFISTECINWAFSGHVH